MSRPARPGRVVGSNTSATFTSDFRDEFESERERWLRRRFLWYTGVVAAYKFLSTLFIVDRVTASRPGSVLELIIHLALIGAFAGAFVWASRHRFDRARLLRIAFWLIVANGVVIVSGIAAESMRAPGSNPASLNVGLLGLSMILVTHLLASLFLPWTARESLAPVVTLAGFNALLVLGVSLARGGGGFWGPVLTILLSPLFGVPGVLVCFWRHSRFRTDFANRLVRGRYNEMRRELVDARRIHEALFPQPVTAGPLRLSYTYEPMRQIGGDYLFASTRPIDPQGPGLLNIVVMDVTGHGIPAALTVNRLHGELERVFAENPRVEPGEVLALLNRYVHLTLATHSVYVTALCFRFDPGAGTLAYASGGHPPAFLRAVDGSIERLDSTALVLGAAAGPDFEAGGRTLPFGPGDCLIAYTDGATEARDERGRMLGIAGLQRIIATGRPERPGLWPEVVLGGVASHRYGPIADDTLVIEVHRPVGAEPTRTGPATRSAAVRPERAARPDRLSAN